MDQKARCVLVANGEVQAQQVRAFLEASGIRTAVRGESLRNTHGLTLNGLGAVEIFVDEADVEEARSLLDSVEAGQFRLGDDPENQEKEGPAQTD
jgi:hypothetical protein